jgi:hypothetical protein
MLGKILSSVVTLALPFALAAQAPQVPNAHASDTAKAAVAAHRHPKVTHHRGTVEAGTSRNAKAATPAVPATRATPAKPAHGEGPAVPAVPAKPATPATPASSAPSSNKPSDPGANGHRP